MPVVGVIGLGVIGRGVASGLIRAGVDLVVCDVQADATEPFADRARVATGPAQTGEWCDLVVIAVVSDDQVLAVLDGEAGALAHLKPGSTVVVLSTIGLDTVRTVAGLAAAAGVAVLDCGVSGGPSAAAEGTLVAMVGGDEADVERARPVLETFCSLVVRIGPLGAGLQAKLARNVAQYGAWLAAYEAQRLAEAAGVKLSKLAEVIRASDLKAGGVSALMFRQTSAPFGPEDDAGLVNAMRAAAALAHKDLRAALELAGELGLDLPMTTLADTKMDSVFGFGGEA